MSIWFVIPADQETAFCAAYLEQHVRGADRPDEDEVIGHMAPGTNAADDSVLMTGSDRVTSAQADSMKTANSSWLEFYTEFPPEDVWKPPPRDDDI